MTTHALSIPIVLMLLALLLTACSIGQQAQTAPTAAPAPQPTAVPPPENVTVGDIVENADDLTGQVVTVSGEVNSIVSPRAFTIGGEGFLDGAEALVVSDRPLAELIEGQSETNQWVRGIAQATGPVQMFDLAQFEKDLAVDFDDQLLSPWAGKPAVVLQSLNLTPRVAAPAAPAADGALTVAQIMGNQAAYIGKSVTVRGEVEEVFGTSGFKLDEGSVLTGGIDNDLRVLASKPGLAAIDDQLMNDEVIVTGMLRNFVLADIEREYGLDLQPEIEAEFESRPVLVADSVQMVDTTAGAAPTPDAAAPAADGNVTVADIVGNPTAYMDKSITIRGDVDTVLNPRAFTLDDGSLLTGGVDNDLLVIGATNAYTLDDGWLDNKVDVKGTIRTFVMADIEREYGLDLGDPQFATYENRLVLIADTIEQLPAR